MAKAKVKKPSKKQQEETLKEKQEAFFEGGGYVPTPEDNFKIGQDAAIAEALVRGDTSQVQQIASAQFYHDDYMIVNATQEKEPEMPWDTILQKFLDNPTKGHLKIFMKDSEQNHKESLFFLSLVNCCDVPIEYCFNSGDDYSINHYYSSMGETLEFILEKKNKKIELTVSKN